MEIFINTKSLNILQPHTITTGLNTLTFNLTTSILTDGYITFYQILNIIILDVGQDLYKNRLSLFKTFLDI